MLKGTLTEAGQRFANTVPSCSLFILPSVNTVILSVDKGLASTKKGPDRCWSAASHIELHNEAYMKAAHIPWDDGIFPAQ